MGDGGVGKSDALTGWTQYTHILYKRPGHIPHRWIMNTKLICKALYFYMCRWCYQCKTATGQGWQSIYIESMSREQWMLSGLLANGQSKISQKAAASQQGQPQSSELLYWAFHCSVLSNWTCALTPNFSDDILYKRLCTGVIACAVYAPAVLL